MAKIPNVETMAREVIAVLHADGMRPGQGMPIPSARQQFGLLRPPADFGAAVDYAQSLGWVELTRQGFWITLTAKGFEEV